MTNKASPPRVLIVDDEEALRFFTAEALLREGWEPEEADSGEAALAMLEKKSYDVVILDLRMGGMDGLSVMRQVKERWPETMVIIMTAYASIDSAIEAVRQGAYDYLRKPCSAHDIVSCANRARAKKEALDQERHLAGLAQAGSATTAVSERTNAVQTGALMIELGAHLVLLAGQPVALTPTEYELLKILAQSPGQPISLEQLIQDGLGYDPADPQAQETLRVHISRLRRKLDTRYILTVRGGGYALAKIPPLT